jgi:hypothetical protein
VQTEVLRFRWEIFSFYEFFPLFEILGFGGNSSSAIYLSLPEWAKKEYLQRLK